jgi:hypothetical protein
VELRSEPCAPVEEESFNRRIRNPAAGLTDKQVSVLNLRSAIADVPAKTLV